jgi:thymidylate kinase
MVDLGRLLVFEGPDGVGKSTLANAVYAHLTSMGAACELHSFPGDREGSLGRLVYRLHHAPNSHGVISIDATSLQVLHVAAHIDLIKSSILPALKTGKDVVLDRFWWSTWVYGKVSGVDSRSLEEMRLLELANWGDILPKCLFLIHRSSPINRKESLDRWNRLSVEYRLLAKEEEKKYTISFIENEGCLSEAVEEVLGLIPGR